MEHALLNPNQLQLNDVEVHDCPWFLLEKHTELLHSIYFPKDNVRLPLS
jgi:hypothetical protein